MRRLLVGLVALCTLVSVSPALAADKAPDDRIVVSGPVTVERGEVVPGDVAVLDGDVLIRGTVRGDVIVVDGDLTVRGKIGGDVVTVGGRAMLGRATRISGDLVYFDKKPIRIKGSKVNGDVTQVDGNKVLDSFGIFAILAWAAVVLSAFVLGLLLLLIAPRAADAIAKTAKSRWAISIGVGLAAFILLPVIGGAACLTILGIPLGIVVLMLLIPLYAIGFVATSFAVGRLIIKGARILAFVVGLLILGLASLIPFVGAVVALLAVIWGLGLVFTTMFRVRNA